MSYDFAIVGGGIVGVSAAAHLAAEGASVVLCERHELAAAASGRNQGVIQHPFDPVLAPLHAESLEHHRTVLDLPANPWESRSSPTTPRRSRRRRRDIAVDRAPSCARR